MLRNYNNNGPVSSSFIMSRGQHRQSGAIPFYSCCLWISVDWGAVITYGEVSINKLRLTSFIAMLLYCILYQCSYCDNYFWINVVSVQISMLNGTLSVRSRVTGARRHL